MSKQLTFSGAIVIPSDAFEAADFLTKAKTGFKEAAAAISEATGVKVTFQTKVTTPRKPKAAVPAAFGESASEGDSESGDEGEGEGDGGGERPGWAS